MSPKTEIYLIRHAESWFNRDRSNKQYNCGITGNGIKQCILLSKLLEDTYFDIVILSPLFRCQQTFEFINLKFKTLIVHPLCREHKVDNCDFFVNEEIIKEPDIMLELRIFMFKDYLRNLISKLNVNTNSTIKIAIITHADFIFNFDTELIDNEVYGNWIDNAEYITISNFT